MQGQSQGGRTIQPIGNIQKYVILPDTHAPYHDKKKFNTFVNVCKILKPYGLVIGGDFIDGYPISDHDKDPRRKWLLKEELEVGNELLDRLQNITSIKDRRFIMGNHEDRLRRLIWTKAPGLEGLIDIPTGLRLKERGYKITAYKKFDKVGKIYFTHDTGKAGIHAHYEARKDVEDNIVIFHTHRIGYTIVGNARGVPHVAAMVGWMGDKNKTDYMHLIKANRDWANGFGIGYKEPNGTMHIQPVPFIGDHVLIEGKIYGA